MRIAVKSKDFKRAFTAVKRFTARHYGHDLFASVKITLNPNRVFLMGCDGDNDISYGIHGKTEGTDEHSVAVVGAKRLGEMVKGFHTEEVIDIEIVEGKISFRVGSIDLAVESRSTENFPEIIPPVGEEIRGTATMEADWWRDLFRKINFVIPNEETRHYINGMFLHREKKGKKTLLRAVSTDGHRLSIAETEMPKGLDRLSLYNPITPKKSVAEETEAQKRRREKRDKEISYTIVPRKAALECARLLGKKEVEVVFEFSETKCSFFFYDETETIAITAKLINGTYPNYKRVTEQVKRDNPHEIKIGGVALYDGFEPLRRVEGKYVSLELTKTTMAIAVETDLNDYEKVKRTIEVESPVSGRIGLNKGYLADYIKSAESQTHRVAYKDEGSPLAFTSGKGYTHIVMPYRLPS